MNVREGVVVIWLSFSDDHILYVTHQAEEPISYSSKHAPCPSPGDDDDDDDVSRRSRPKQPHIPRRRHKLELRDEHNTGGQFWLCHVVGQLHCFDMKCSKTRREDNFNKRSRTWMRLHYKRQQVSVSSTSCLLPWRMPCLDWRVSTNRFVTLFLFEHFLIQYKSSNTS